MLFSPMFFPATRIKCYITLVPFIFIISTFLQYLSYQLQIACALARDHYFGTPCQHFKVWNRWRPFEKCAAFQNLLGWNHWMTLTRRQDNLWQGKVADKRETTALESISALVSMKPLDIFNERPLIELPFKHLQVWNHWIYLKRHHNNL